MFLFELKPVPQRKFNPMTKSRRKDHLTRQLTALIMAHGLATVTHAQSTNPPPSNATITTNAPAKLPDVVVKGQQEPGYKPEALFSPKYTEPLRDIPQTVTVIPKAVFEEQGATSLRDVLRNVPGISMQAGEGGVPSGDNLSIRGFNARTDMFIDGVRDFGGYSRDPFNIEQIEVAKGPSSSYAGRGSTGGSINLSTKVPSLAKAYSGSFGYGTDDFKRVTLDLNQPLEGVLKGTATRLNAMFNDADVPGRDLVMNQRWGVAPAIAFGLGTPTRMILSYSHLGQDNLPDYGVPWVTANNTNAILSVYANSAPPVDFENFYGLKSRDYEKTDTDVVTAKVEHDFNNSASLRNLTRYGRNYRDSVITAPRFVDFNPSPTITQEGTTINRQIQSRDQADTVVANQTDFTLRFETAKVEHTLVPGFEFSRETSLNYARAGLTSMTDLFRPAINDPSPGAVTRTGAYTDATADSAAVYAFDTIKFNEQWQINGGLRWDYFDLDYKSATAAGLVTPLSRKDTMLSWRVGAVYKPLSNGSIYATYGTSFNPSAEGLTLANTATAVNSINTPPEETLTYELGTKWDLFDNKLSLGLALFRTEKTNARTEDPADPADVIVLDGEQRVDGIELSAAGSITTQWKVFGGYAFMVSEVTKSKNPVEVGRPLSNTPEQTFTLWTTYDLTEKFQAGGGARFTDRRVNSTTTQRWAPGYPLYDAMLAYNVNKSFTLRLNLYNLSDEQYIDRVGGGHFVPGAGRSALLTASLKF
jgi:catecholate siderophore receptor